MKKIMLIAAAIMSLQGASAVFASGPYTTGMTADVFDTTPDAIPTPNMTGPGTIASPVPDVYKAVNVLLGTSYVSNSDVDHLQYTADDSFWTNVGDVNHGGVSMIGLSAARTNTLSVYATSAPAVKLNPFGTSFTGFGLKGNGTLASPFPSAGVPLAFGTEFGWSLKSTGSSTTVWDSDATLNSDGIDHMLTYHLTPLAGQSLYLKNTITNTVYAYKFTDPYLITWENQSLANNGIGSDQDYNDLIYLVDRVVPGNPVPEPMSMALFGIGLAGMSVVGYRQRKKA